MRNWKALLTGLLAFCLLPFLPYTVSWSEEYYEEEIYEEPEDPIPDSYYYPIESNDIAGWPQGPAIESAAAVVMDMDTNTFLYSKNATATMYPASTTKIMTTLLLVENCNLDDEITFSEIIYDLEEGSSHLGIQAGETLTLRQAAYGIMLASANDISNGVAEYMGGSLSGFADMMNARAAELGCVNTHFSNPHGLYSEDHYTCAYDMALIAKAAYDNPTFREIVGTKEYTIPQTEMSEEDRSFLNHHKMMQKDEEYYRDWCTGGKTGFTSQCLNTLVTFGEKDGKRLVSVVFRVNGAGKAYNESTQILNYGFDNFTTELTYGISKNHSLLDIWQMNYLGDAGKMQPDVWKRPLLTNSYRIVTYPNTGSVNMLKAKVIGRYGKTAVFSYEYEGHSAGMAEGTFNTLFIPAQSVFEKKVDVVLPAETTSGDKIQVENFDDVLTQAGELFSHGYTIVKDYAENHFATVLAGGIVLFLLIMVFVIIVIFRLTSDSRIQRRRKQEEKERKLREEEIDRMTTAEIEAELRAVMKQEQLKRAQEEFLRAEAERAAEEARLSEEKAHETERLIDELERERQERLSERINTRV